MNERHERFMQYAIDEAKEAGCEGEVPVGAVVVDIDGNILSRAHNRVIASNDPSSHAEVIALRQAASKSKNFRLLNTTLYATIEPCIMCMGMMVHARIKCVVFGAKDPKWGAAGSLYNFASDHRLNHEIEVVSGICREQCRRIIQDFFRARRNGKKRT